MCDLIHTWEKVRRRGGFLKFRYARSPVSRPIGRRLFAHALRDLSAASTTESLSRSGAMASRGAVVSPSRNVCAKPSRFSPNSVVIDHGRLMSRRSMAVGETPWATAPSRQQLQPIDDHPDRRDCGPAHICEHLAPRRRQDHLDREIAIVWRAIQLAGEVKARGERRRGARIGRQLRASATSRSIGHGGRPGF